MGTKGPESSARWGFFAKAFVAALVLAVLLVVLAALLIIVVIKVEVREEHFATHQDLLGSAIDVGYPMTMPRTNIDIHVKYDTDTGISWSRSNCVEDHMRLALKSAKPVTPADLSADESGVRLGGDRYREGRTDWWPEALRERQMREGLPPDYGVFSVLEEEWNYRYYIFVRSEPCRAYHYSPGEVSG